MILMPEAFYEIDAEEIEVKKPVSYESFKKRVNLSCWHDYIKLGEYLKYSGVSKSA